MVKKFYERTKLRALAVKFSRKFLILLGIFIVLAIIPLTTEDPFISHVLIMSFFWSAAGSAWNILGGYCGQLSLGHATYFGLGAYICLLMLIIWGYPPIIGMFCGAILSVAAALFITYPCSRLRGTYFSLATLAFAESMRIVFLIFRDATGGAVGLGVPYIGEIPFLGAESMDYVLTGNPLIYFQFESKIPYYYIAFGLMLLLIYATRRIENSKFGVSMQAIREDEDAALSLGVPSSKSKLCASAVSAVLTSICGSFYALYVRYIVPETVFGLMMSVQMVIVTILGGMGTIWGPILGSFILIPASELLRTYLAGALVAGHMIIYGMTMIVIILALPQGILPFLIQHSKKLESKLTEQT